MNLRWHTFMRHDEGEHRYGVLAMGMLSDPGLSEFFTLLGWALGTFGFECVESVPGGVIFFADEESRLAFLLKASA